MVGTKELGNGIKISIGTRGEVISQAKRTTHHPLGADRGMLGGETDAGPGPLVLGGAGDGGRDERKLLGPVRDGIVKQSTHIIPRVVFEPTSNDGVVCDT